MSADPQSAGFVQPNHLVVLGHPDPDSFGAAVARAYCAAIHACGHQATLRDLYAIGFDPLLRNSERPGAGPFIPAADVTAELELLREADVITLVYPLWFGMPPAIIKGYIDRVLGAGFSAEAIKSGTTHPMLHGKRLMLFTSSASTRPWLEERGQWTGLRQAFETYLATIFGLKCGGHTHFDAIVPDANPRLIEECLTVAGERARAASAEILSEKRARQSFAIRRGAGS